MTTDLQAAIARLTADEYEKDAKVRMPHAFDSGRAAAIARRAREEDLLLVAAATLDARPITAEGLKERGFGERRTQLCNRYSRGDLECAMWDGGLTVWRLEDATLPDKLQPQTQGDLTTLLLRLARGME